VAGEAWVTEEEINKSIKDDYQFPYMSMKIYHHTVRQFDLFPASLLVKRPLWQRMAQALPANGCLLIMQHDSRTQAQLVQRLGHAFRAQGRRVFVLKVG
jgi:hypothetical protein